MGYNEAGQPWLEVTATTFSLEDREYHIDPRSRGYLPPPQHTSISVIDQYVPCTIVTWAGETITNEDVENIRRDYEATDDVWCAGFLQHVMVRSPQAALGGHSIGIKTIHKDLMFATAQNIPETTPDGPHAWSVTSGTIHSISRLFRDDLSAFIGGAVAREAYSTRFHWVSGCGEHILVPSRLGFKTSLEKPLSGLRFAVKDLIDVASLETGCGNRAYRATYSAKEKSAPFIDQLLEAGAWLVGKTKTSSFADGSVPSSWLDYIAPFNPRGDGYQGPSGSSTGSAVAAAGYDWLDFTIGTDTGGSIRHPAGVNGLYGNRPSLGSVKSEGYIVTPLMDTVGVFARSAKVLSEVNKVMRDPELPKSKSRTEKSRYKLVCLIRKSDAEGDDTYRFFPRPDKPGEAPSVEERFEKLIKELESHLECSRVNIEIEELWSKTHPETMPPDIVEATNTLYQNIVYPDSVTNAIDPFIQKYHKENGGRKPAIEAKLAARQAYGRNLPFEKVTAAKRDLELYAAWIKEVLFATDREDEIPILLVPQSWGQPDYRDEPDSPMDSSPLFWDKFSIYSISYASGCPDITIPIDEVPYQSKVTETEEWLPISLSIMALPGEDEMLLRLVEELEETKILRPVKTGSRMYNAS